MPSTTERAASTALLLACVLGPGSLLAGHLKPCRCLRPQCQDVRMLERLLQAGVSCARVDLSWGTKEYHARRWVGGLVGRWLCVQSTAACVLMVCAGAPHGE